MTSRLYGTAAVIGAACGLLLALGLLPAAPRWPSEWGIHTSSPAATLLLPVVAGALVGLALAAVAHLGVRWQLRRRSRR